MSLNKLQHHLVGIIRPRGVVITIEVGNILDCSTIGLEIALRVAHWNQLVIDCVQK